MGLMIINLVVLYDVATEIRPGDFGDFGVFGDFGMAFSANTGP